MHRFSRSEAFSERSHIRSMIIISQSSPQCVREKKKINPSTGAAARLGSCTKVLSLVLGGYTKVVHILIRTQLFLYSFQSIFLKHY